MKIRTGFALAALAAALGLAPDIAAAQRLESMTLANNLGTVLSSEQFCGLEFNQQAIQAFIEKNVKADDMGFAGTLQMMISGHQVENQQMSPSAKTAHCAQIARVAKSYGFIK
jgi:hypothetical protein